MKLPPGYGQIIKLSGKRRRPYAVRVDDGVAQSNDGHFVRKVKYLEYFEKKSDALTYLAKYNAGIVIEKQPPLTALPSFSEVFDGFMEYYSAKHKDASLSALSAYQTAYKNAASLHQRKFQTLRTDDLQKVISEHSHQSQSTIANLIKLFHQMYKYAMMNEMVEKDYSQFVFNEYTKSDKPAHIPFTEDEIRQLWKIKAYPVLIMIFTGLRVTEFLTLKNKNVDLDTHIMRGGIKTAAGKDRVIPIHDAILPIIEKMKSEKEYLYDGSREHVAFQKNEWADWMESFETTHTPHDTRHTAASLMERYGVPLHHAKLILGHAVTDLTQGVYTHIESSVLVEDINRIPSFK